MAYRTRFTPKRKRIFLDILRSNGNVSKAANAAGISRRGVYDHREANPEFAEEWDQAIHEFIDNLEDEARRRAYDGCVKPVYQGGKEVGEIREYSDTLLIFLLKGGRPEKFRERAEITGKLKIELPDKPVEEIDDNELDAYINKLEQQLQSR